VTNHNNRERIVWIDVARGLGILAVVIGHSVIQGGSLSVAIFTFHMPLFFLLSGYCTSFKSSAGSFIKKKALSLLLPYLCTMGLAFLYWRLFYRDYSGDLNGTWPILKLSLLQILYGSGNVVAQIPYLWPIGPIWFLPALFAANLISLGISRLNTEMKTTNLILMVAICAICGMLIGKNIFLPFSVDIALVSQIFIFFGLALKEEALFEKKVPIFMLILSLVAFEVSRRFGGMSMNNRTYHDLLVSSCGAIGGSVLVLQLAIFLSKYYIICHVLEYFGRAAIVILCFHTFDTGFGHFDIIWPEIFKFMEKYPILLIIYRLTFTIMIYEIFRRIPLMRACYSLPLRKRVKVTQ
jgi:fucose 4-O-acetylase-like acetyltransferase